MSTEERKIRCVSLSENKVRYLSPLVAENNMRMKQMGYEINDIEYLKEKEIKKGIEEKKKCVCGKSANMPYCDGTHEDIKPTKNKK